MFQLISNFFKFISREKTNQKESKQSYPGLMSQLESGTLYSSLDKNRRVLEELFDLCDDLVLREVSIGVKNPVKALIAYFDPLVNLDLLQRVLLNALLNVDPLPKSGVTTAWLKEKVIPVGDVGEKRLWEQVANDISRGMVGVFVDGQDHALLLNIFEKNHRDISPPTTETVVRGPSDAFNEDLRTNIALLRKRLNTTRLAVENLEIGEISTTTISLVYIKGLVTENLVQEIKKRLNRLKIDAVLGSGHIEEFIQDNPYSPFSTIETTERPDRMYGHLLEGSIGLLFNNTPFSLLIPATLASQLQSPEDYYNRYWFSSFIRLLRWVGLLTALLLPSFYISTLR